MHCGLEKAPVHYQVIGKCEEEAILLLVQTSANIQRQERLAVYEWAIDWGLGLCTLNQDILDLRAGRGLPAWPGMVGANGTPCLDGPGASLKGGTNDEGTNFGIQNRDYMNCDYMLLRRASYQATATAVLALYQSSIAREAAIKAAVHRRRREE